jgi:hypothetical protein
VWNRHKQGSPDHSQAISYDTGPGGGAAAAGVKHTRHIWHAREPDALENCRRSAPTQKQNREGAACVRTARPHKQGVSNASEPTAGQSRQPAAYTSCAADSTVADAQPTQQEPRQPRCLQKKPRVQYPVGRLGPGMSPALLLQCCQPPPHELTHVGFPSQNLAGCAEHNQRTPCLQAGHHTFDQIHTT